MRFVGAQLVPARIARLATVAWDAPPLTRVPSRSEAGPRRSASPISSRCCYDSLSAMSQVPRLPRWRSVSAVAVVVLLFVLIGHSAILRTAIPTTTEQTHSVMSWPGDEFTVNIDHAHLFDGSLVQCHDVLATLPPSTIRLVELAAAAVASAAMPSNPRVPGERGPPQVLGPVLNGQDLLTRLCTARR